MQRGEINGEPQRMTGRLGTVHADDHRTFALVRGQLIVIMVNRHTGGERMRDIILHALVLVAGDPDHRHRHLGGFGEGGRQRPHEPSGHATQGSAADDDLLGIRSDLQQSSRAGGMHGGELQVIRSNAMPALASFTQSSSCSVMALLAFSHASGLSGWAPISHECVHA